MLLPVTNVMSVEKFQEPMNTPFDAIPVSMISVCSVTHWLISDKSIPQALPAQKGIFCHGAAKPHMNLEDLSVVVVP